jgi:hypothetical protein
MLVTTIQCASSIDAITDDGEPLYQKPYPYHISPDGAVLQQGFWQGKIHQLVGFQRNIEVQRVDMFWSTIAATGPTEQMLLVRGMYPVFKNKDGEMFTLITPVDTIEHREFTDEQLEVLER